ncbi:MAG TPA: CcmD family protein [Candidatus Kryptonia bacterium]|nr:CcmD family protein [Candidatus Kryptonia bacterium]
MANLSFLFAAYTAIWVLLFLYVANIARRNRALQREIDELREFLRRQSASGSPTNQPGS